MARKSDIRITPVKRGRRHYGAIYDLPSGHRVYLAHRRLGEIFRAGEKSIRAAIAARTAAWALDEETLIQMRAQGIKFVGVLVRETGDKFLTELSWFFDKTRAKVMNYERRGGALQRYLPLQYFRRLPGHVLIK